MTQELLKAEVRESGRGLRPRRWVFAVVALLTVLMLILIGTDFRRRRELYLNEKWDPTVLGRDDYVLHPALWNWTRQPEARKWLYSFQPLTSVWPSEASSIELLTSERYLESLNYPLDLTQREVANVAKLKSLTTFHAWGLDLGEEGLAPLRELPQLDEVQFSCLRSESGLEGLSQLPQLRSLTLGFRYRDGTDDIAPNVLVIAAKCLKLISLSVGNSGKRTSDFSTLASNSELRTLRLFDMQLRAKDFAQIAKLPQLTHLSLINCGIDLGSFKALSGSSITQL